jgi:hypothetical protein
MLPLNRHSCHICPTVCSLELLFHDIVKTCIEACRGTVSARNLSASGLEISIVLQARQTENQAETNSAADALPLSNLPS